MAYEGILFVTTDGTKWGSGKGSPLSSVEADTNLFTLAEKVKDLEDNPPAPIEIGSFQVVGSQMKVFLTDGTEFGPFTLPTAQFVFRDEWVGGGVPYFELDLVSVAGQGLFLVRLDHDSAASFDPDATDGDGHPLYLKVFGEDTYIYTFGFFYPGKPGYGLAPGDMMFAHLLGEEAYIPGTGAGSLARLRVAPTATMLLSIFKNGDEVGSVSFGAGETEGEFFFDSTDVEFAPGDVCYVRYPDDGIDATAKDFTMTIKGFRGSVPS